MRGATLTVRRGYCLAPFPFCGRRATALLAMLLFGCQRASSATTVIELWAMGREGEVVERMMPEFERRHPGVQVRVQQIPWSAAHEKLLTAYVGDAMPDVFQAGNTWLPELVALGALEPLDQWVAGSQAVERGDYFEGILETNLIDGVAYGVPWYVDTRLLFYRPDLLREAGYPEPPRTWASWNDAMVQLKKLRGGGGYAILLPAREWQPLVILAFQLGADLLRDGGQYGNFKSAPFRRALEVYLEFFRADLAPRTGASEVGNLYHEFARGYFSLYITGPWNLGEFGRRLPPELSDRWSTTPLPAFDGAYPGVSLAGGASLAVFKSSTRKAEAWKLVEYLSEPVRQIEFYRLTGDLPARRTAWAEAELVGDRRVRAFWEQLQAVRSTPKIPEWERIASTISRHADAAVRGKLSVDQTLTALDEDVDRLLEKRRWLVRRSGRVPSS